jgi:hypothetical protein
MLISNIYYHYFFTDWKLNINSINSYSSSKKDGGSALLDLSHEINFRIWIFRKIKKIAFEDSNKISRLSINVKDHLLVAEEVCKIKFIINMNYYKKKIERLLKIYDYNFTFKTNLISINNKKKKRFKN